MSNNLTNVLNTVQTYTSDINEIKYETITESDQMRVDSYARMVINKSNSVYFIKENQLKEHLQEPNVKKVLQEFKEAEKSFNEIVFSKKKGDSSAQSVNEEKKASGSGSHTSSVDSNERSSGSEKKSLLSRISGIFTRGNKN